MRISTSRSDHATFDKAAHSGPNRIASSRDPQLQTKPRNVRPRMSADRLFVFRQIGIREGHRTHWVVRERGPQRPDITVEVDAEPARIPIDRAVPAGLVVNEL